MKLEDAVQEYRIYPRSDRQFSSCVGADGSWPLFLPDCLLSARGTDFIVRFLFERGYFGNCVIECSDELLDHFSRELCDDAKITLSTGSKINNWTLKETTVPLRANEIGPNGPKWLNPAIPEWKFAKYEAAIVRCDNGSGALIVFCRVLNEPLEVQP